MHHSLILPVVALGLLAPHAAADFIPLTAMRRVASGFPAPNITSNTLGLFNQSQPGGGTGGGSTPQSVFATGSQHSTIDGSMIPQILTDLRVNGRSTGGSPTNTLRSPVSSLQFTFQGYDTGTTFSHNLARATVGSAISLTATLTPQGQSAINLLKTGSSNFAILPGVYTLNLQVTGAVSGSLSGSSLSDSLIGSISIVPAAPTVALLRLGGCVAARRRPF